MKRFPGPTLFFKTKTEWEPIAPAQEKTFEETIKRINEEIIRSLV